MGLAPLITLNGGLMNDCNGGEDDVPFPFSELVSLVHIGDLLVN